MNQSKPHDRLLGKETALTGMSAIEIVESAISEGITQGPFHDARNIFGRPLIQEQNDSRGIAFAMGLSSSGLRASVSLQGRDVLREEEQLVESARRHLAYVVHVFTQNKDRDGRWQDTDHRHVHAVSDTGWIQLFASCVQEAVDLTIIGHKIAELSLCPVMVVVENSYSTAEQVVLPDRIILKEFLGHGDDFIECPTPAQKLIFGKSRRRIPNWFHFDFPTIQGITKTGQALSFELAAQQAYFGSHVDAIAGGVFKEYALLTGREYASVASYKMEDAEYAVLVQGSSYHRAASVADFLRSKKIKAGSLHLRFLRPFPGKELCEQLTGKKCVTILERVTQPMDFEPPIFRDVLSALDKAAQNSAKKRKLVFPDYPTMTERQRPALYSGQYGTGHSSLTYSDILQVFENMTGDGRRRFFVDIDFTRPVSSYPKQNILFQNIKRDYPDITSSSLNSSRSAGIAPDQAFALRWRMPGTSQEELLETLTGLLSRRWDARVRTAMVGSDAQAVSYQLNLTRRPWPYPIEKNDEADGLVTDVSALKSLSCLEGLKKGAVIVIMASSQTEPIRLPQSVAERIGQMKFRLFRLPKIAQIEELLFGVFLILSSQFFTESVDPAKEISWIERYLKEFRGHTLSDLQKDAIRHGLTQLEGIKDISVIKTEEPEPVELPLALRRYEDHGPPYSRISQFYDRVGYFYETEVPGEMVADPFHSIPVLPAVTASFIRTGTSRESVPEFVPSKCTGCGQCSVYCPESAIPPIIISAESFIKSQVDRAQANGVSMTEWTPPVIKTLAKLIHQELYSPPENMTTLGGILPDILNKLASQLKMEGERLQKLREQCSAVMPSMNEFRLAVTKTFFADPERQMKGSGRLFSVAVNPQSCTGCGLCADVCLDNALIMSVQNHERSLQLQSQFHLWEQLPDTPGDIIQTMVQDKSYDPFAAILLSRNYYMAMAGGLGSEKNISEKMMTHLVVSVAESVTQSNTNKHIKEIEHRITTLSEKIQNKLREALPTDNFDNLINSLSGSENARISLDTVIKKLSETQRFGMVETAWMERVVSLINDLKTLTWALSKGPTGVGRSRFGTVVSGTDLMEWTKQFPYNAFSSPVVINDNPDSMNFVGGLCHGHIRQMIDNIKLLRRADLEMQNQYDPMVHDEQIANLSWHELTENEKSFVPPLLVLTDYNRMSEINLPSLLELLSSGFPIKVFLFDSGAGTADYWRGRMAITTAVMSLRNSFLLQSSMAKPDHLFQGLMDGLHHPTPGFFHILVPAISLEDKPNDVYQLALQSRAFPLFRFVPSAQKKTLSMALDLSANPDSYEDFVSMSHEQGNQSVTYSMTFADWAIRQPNLEKHFKLMDDQERRGVPVSEYLAMASDVRSNKIPFLLKAGRENLPEKYEVSETIVKAAEAAHLSWNTLRELAGMMSPYPEKLKERIDEEWAARHAAAMQQAKVEYDEKLQRSESEQLEKIKQKLSEKLLALSGYENNS